MTQKTSKKETGFESGLIRRSVQVSLVVIPLVSVYGLFMFSPKWALIYGASAFWNTVNVHLWYKLLRELLINRNRGSSFALAGIKIPVLYGAGALLIRLIGFSVAPFLVGFNTILAIILLKLLGREYIEAIAKNRSLERTKTI